MRCWVRGRDFWLEIPSGPVGINQRVKKYVYIYFLNRYLPKLKIASNGVQCPIYDLGHDTELIFPQKTFFNLNLFIPDFSSGWAFKSHWDSEHDRSGSGFPDPVTSLAIVIVCTWLLCSLVFGSVFLSVDERSIDWIYTIDS